MQHSNIGSSTAIEQTLAKEVAYIINSKGVHYEYCGKYNESDNDFISQLGNVSEEDVLRVIDNGYSMEDLKIDDIGGYAAFLVEMIYLNKENYDFHMEGSMICLNK